ncbi:MAG: GIY-YIG nuclease family protein [Siculibacillus sp.]|nr:GIY-YIG nuclease family protein [Siculibacillus sp.]
MVDELSPEFKIAICDIHLKFERLINSPPYDGSSSLPEKGVYLFRENGNSMYVGRSNNIRRRMRQHTKKYSKANQAGFAAKIAKFELKIETTYRMGAKDDLENNPEFQEAFKIAKYRVQKMKFFAIEEQDQMKQSLLEIYCAITLSTPYNDFGTH